MASYVSVAWDEAAFRALNLAGSAPATDALMVGLSLASTAYVLGALAIPLWLRGQREGAFDLLVVLGAAMLVTEAIKFALGRPRPCDPGVLVAVRTIPGFGCEATFDPAFPSGHASRAFAVAAFVLVRFRWRPGFAAFGFAGLAGLSRVYLGVHWPSDVIGGAAVGVGIAFLVVVFVTKLPIYVRLRTRVVDVISRWTSRRT